MSVEKWDQRTLCPDGACIGLIGDAGTCNTCGRAMPNWGEERKRGLRDESGPIVTADLAVDPIEPAAPAQLGALGRPPEWKERQLCSDGGCIGLIGADGTCKVCGRPAGAPIGEDLEGEAEDDEEDEEDDDEYEDDDEDSEGEAFVDEDDADAKADQAELEAAADELAALLPAESPPTVGRALCPDGGCVGLIGDDGKCKVCGKEAA